MTPNQIRQAVTDMEEDTVQLRKNLVANAVTIQTIKEMAYKIAAKDHSLLVPDDLVRMCLQLCFEGVSYKEVMEVMKGKQEDTSNHSTAGE